MSRVRTDLPGVDAEQIPVRDGHWTIMGLRDRMDAIATWCNGEAELFEAGVTVPTAEGTKMAYPGDWVIRSQSGGFEVWTPAETAAYLELVGHGLEDSR